MSEGKEYEVEDALEVNKSTEEGTQTDAEDNTPVKKPKLEDKEDEVEDFLYDDDGKKKAWKIEDFFPDFDLLSDEDKAALIKYHDQFTASEGYELDFCPVSFFGKFIPLELEPGSYPFDNCIKAVQNVVKFMNQKKDAHLEFLEVIGGTYRSLHEFLVTFKAKDIISGEIKLCKSHLYRNPLDGETGVFRFKQKSCTDSI